MDIDKNIVLDIISIFNGIGIDTLSSNDKMIYFNTVDKMSKILKIMYMRLEEFKYQLVNGKLNFNSTIPYKISDKNTNLIIELIFNCMKNDIPDFDLIIPSNLNTINIEDPKLMKELIETLDHIDKWKNM